MSKYVKELVTDDLKQRLVGVQDAVVVSLAGLKANTAHRLRAELRGKNIQVLVLKNSLARRATEGTALSAAFVGLSGPTALVWGGSDIVAVAKEVSRLAGDKAFAPLSSRGGVLDGQQLSATDVDQVAKWPSREEQLSIVVGQVLSPGANLVSQLTSAGGALASQISQRGEADEADAAAEAPVEGEAAAG